MIDPKLAIRIKKAWAALTPEQQAKVGPHLQIADSHLQAVLSAPPAAPQQPVSRRELLYAKSALEDKAEVYVASAKLALTQSATLGCQVPVDPSGNILGFGTFQLLDPGWLEAGVLWLEYLVGQNRFPFGAAAPARIPIPDKLTIVLAGDFGTGDWGSAANPAASTKIRQKIAALNPEITIHLGDVYYAGTGSSELGNFVSLWPKGSLGSLALNSNHEMYTGGIPYFQEALGGGEFKLQGGRSLFALENSQWIIVGLDSAYFSDPYSLFMNGAVSDGQNNIQTQFLRDCANAGKKVLVLTHHNGLLEDGTSQSPLWAQVRSAFPAGKPPALWYWGHAHAGVVYKTQASDGIACRCVGHGALPWGRASSLANSNAVSWFESRSANDPDDPQRVLNGYAVLAFDGANVTETLYDENGNVAWRQP